MSISRFLLLLTLVWPCCLTAAESELAPTVIDWQAPADCPTSADVVGLVERRLGQPLSAPRAQALRLSAKIERSQRGDYELVLSSEGSRAIGLRRLSDSDCARLTEAAALVMALAIDPELVDVREPNPISPNPDQSRMRALDNGTHQVEGAAPAAPSSTPAASRNGSSRTPRLSVRVTGRIAYRPQPERNPHRLGWRATLGSLLSIGSVPGTTFGFAASIGLAPLRVFELRLGVGGLLPKQAAVLDGPSAIRFNAAELNASACAVERRRALQAQVCSGIGFDVVQAQGVKLEQSRVQTAAFASTFLEAGIGYRLGAGWGLVGTAAGALPWTRPTFGIALDGKPTPVYRPDSVLLRLGLGAFFDWN